MEAIAVNSKQSHLEAGDGQSQGQPTMRLRSMQQAMVRESSGQWAMGPCVGVGPEAEKTHEAGTVHWQTTGQPRLIT